MAIVSSHILDSVAGGSATGIRAELFRHDGSIRTPVFDIFADTEGRICESVEISSTGLEYELVLHSARYFSECMSIEDNQQIMKTVIVRFTMPDAEKRYHIPIMLAPHSYSVWWSE